MAVASDIIDAVRRRLEEKHPVSDKPAKSDGPDMDRVAGEMLEALKAGDQKRLARILKAMKEL
jgi:hypothetical protein